MTKLFIFPFLYFLVLNGTSQTYVENSTNVNIDHLHVEPQIMGGGAAFFDFNNDGFDELYITSGMGRDHFYINNQDGTFTEAGITSGLGTTINHNTVGVVTGDIDNDGFRDLFVTTDKFSANLLFKNNGNGTFTDISTQAGITDSAWSASASFGDYNLDGYLDLYVSNYCEFPFVSGIPFYDTTISGVNNFFYVNNGNGTFSEKADLLGVQDDGTALSVTFTDFDNDNDLDIYLGNDFGMDFNPNMLFENLYPIDSFADITLNSGTGAAIYTMGTAIGDYNEDGLLDYYVSNMADNFLYKNNGDQTFSNIATNTSTAVPSVTSWGNFFFDYDNDSYLDLFAASGQMIFRETNQYQINNLFHNNGANNYTDVSLATGLSDSSRSRGAAYSDFDNDGDLDFVLVNVHVDSNVSDRTWFMENQSTSNGNWFKIKLQGTVNNRDGFGAHVELKANGRSFIREVDGGSGYLSHNSNIIHFGLGTISTIDSIIIHWPGGATQVETNFTINQQIEIVENASNHQYICLGDSIFLSGKYQQLDGSYSDTLPNVNGQDSIINTILHVSDSLYTKSIIICTGDSLYLGGTYQTLTGVYTDSLTSFIGCDSIIQTTLLVKTIDTTFNSITICNNDSIYLDGAFRNTEDTYIEAFLSLEGCDSVVVTVLTVHPSYTTPIILNICQGDSLFLEGYYQKNGGVFTDTLPTVLGCDSIIQSTLIINPLQLLDVNISICQNDSLFLEGAYRNIPSTYTDTLSSTFGCDSIIRTHLAILPTQTHYTNTSICQGDSLLINGSYESTSGSYNTIYTSINGCDSVIVNVLTILPAYFNSSQVEICEGDSVLINGDYISNPGVTIDSLIKQNGCDSIIKTTIIVNNSFATYIDTTILTGDSIFLSGHYQILSGIYVDTLISNSGCDSIIYTTVALETISNITSSNLNHFNLYPNPTNGQITISLNRKSNQESIIEFINYLGEVVYEVKINKQLTINIKHLPKGIYLANIYSTNHIETQRIILQ